MKNSGSRKKFPAGFVKSHVILIALALLPWVAADAQEFGSKVEPFLQEHCVDCHGEKKQKSGIRFDKVTEFRAEDVELWTKVHEALEYGDMPPEDETQPEKAAVEGVMDWIKSAQSAARGPVIRRLNRREISASLQDLTGSKVDFAFALPEDGKVGGFDTGADGLQDAADSVASMLEVTGRAVGGLRFLEPDGAKVFDFDLSEESFKDVRRALGQYKDQGLVSKGGAGKWLPDKGVLMNPQTLKDRGGFETGIAPLASRDGVLRLDLVVSSWKPTAFEGLPDPHLSVEIGGRDLEIRAVGPEEETRSYEVRMEELVTDKDLFVIRLKNLVELPYAVKGFENEDKTKPEEKVPGGGGLFRPMYDKRGTAPEESPTPFIVVRRMKVTVGATHVWPPAEWGAEPADAADEPGSAKRLLALWMERAYRRPVEASELEPYLELYASLRGQEHGFDKALKAAFQAVVMSAPFRYLGSPEGGKDPHTEIYTLASRLSFMLTGAPPDAGLRAAVASGALLKPGELDAQVERLVKSPASEGFFNPFVRQWLEMGQPITLVMESLKKVDFLFGRHLKDSMERETVEYIAELFRHNRPAGELVDSDWTMMNQALARYYGYEGVEGSELRRVALRKDDPRGGGILGQAGIQSMLTWMGDNWVIYRGAWTLRHVLDDPPPPAPLEVPELTAKPGKNFRELLAKHQEDVNCTVCHKDMDPLGFAFQNFDLSGRWREVEYSKYVRNELDGKIEWRGEGDTRPVDSKGHLPRGEEFTTFAECKSLIAKNYQRDMLRGILKNLVIYGTGRRPDVQDMTEIGRLLDAAGKNDFASLDLLKSFIRSPIFLGTEPE